MDAEEPIEIDGTTFTKQQVDRQTKRIYDFVFVEATAEEDGSYGGRITEDIMACFQKNLIFDEVVAENAVADMLRGITKDIVELILENVKSVHPLIASAFCHDFVPACMEQFYTIQSAVPPASDFEPAYG